MAQSPGRPENIGSSARANWFARVTHSERTWTETAADLVEFIKSALGLSFQSMEERAVEPAPSGRQPPAVPSDPKFAQVRRLFSEWEAHALAAIREAVLRHLPNEAEQLRPRLQHVRSLDDLLSQMRELFVQIQTQKQIEISVSQFQETVKGSTRGEVVSELHTLCTELKATPRAIQMLRDLPKEEIEVLELKQRALEILRSEEAIWKIETRVIDQAFASIDALKIYKESVPKLFREGSDAGLTSIKERLLAAIAPAKSLEQLRERARATLQQMEQEQATRAPLRMAGGGEDLLGPWTQTPFMLFIDRLEKFFHKSGESPKRVLLLALPRLLVEALETIVKGTGLVVRGCGAIAYGAFGACLIAAVGLAYPVRSFVQLYELWQDMPQSEWENSGWIAAGCTAMQYVGVGVVGILLPWTPLGVATRAGYAAWESGKEAWETLAQWGKMMSVWAKDQTPQSLRHAFLSFYETIHGKMG